MKNSTDVRTLKNLSKSCRYTIPEVKGLHLWVRPNRQKYWVFRYTFNGKRFDYGIGSFNDVPLAEAKKSAQKLRGSILHGINPLEAKKTQKDHSKKVALPTIKFKKFALDYIDTMSPRWRNEKHCDQWANTLTTYAFPVIGNLSLEDINTSHILEILEDIWKTKQETASRLRGRIERILSASITRGLRKSRNPAIWKGHLENILPPPSREHIHHPALPYQDVYRLIIKLHEINTMSSLALEFTILNASRTGEVLFAKKNEIVDGIWTIPAIRMKTGIQHQVPLGVRSLEIISRASELNSNTEYLFSNKTKPLSTMAMIMMLRRFKVGVTVHGFRSSFRDWVSEETNHNPEVAEMALAHAVIGKVEKAYRRGKLLERRRLLMNDWQSYCLTGDFDSEFKANL